MAPLIEDEQYDHEMLAYENERDLYDDRLDYEGWAERYDDDPNPYHGDYSEM